MARKMTQARIDKMERRHRWTECALEWVLLFVLLGLFATVGGLGYALFDHIIPDAGLGLFPTIGILAVVLLFVGIILIVFEILTEWAYDRLRLAMMAWRNATIPAAYKKMRQPHQIA